MKERILPFADRAMTVRSVARCPACAASVGELTNGAYMCDQGHVHHTRFELDGDLRWWHGRLQTPGLLILAACVLYELLRRRVRGEA